MRVTNDIKQQQAANFQALFQGQEAKSASKVEPGRIQRSDGSTASVVQQQAPKKSLGQTLLTPFIWVGQALKNLFTRTVRTEARPAATPASPMSADEIKGGSIDQMLTVDKPAKLTNSKAMQELVMQAIGSGDRDKFNSKANISGGDRSAYLMGESQDSFIQSNPIIKNVLSEFTKLQMNSTQKEWTAMIRNPGSICSKAIEFAEKHQELSKISNPVVREFVNPNASAISLILTLSDAHLQHNFFDRAGFDGDAPTHTMEKTKSLMQENMASLGDEELLAINEQFSKYPIFTYLEGSTNDLAISANNVLEDPVLQLQQGGAIMTAIGKIADIGIMGTQIREIAQDLLSARGKGFNVDAYTAKVKEKANLDVQSEMVQDDTEASRILEESRKLAGEIYQMDEKINEGNLGDFLMRTMVSGGDIHRALDDILHNNKYTPVEQLAPSVDVANPALFGVMREGAA